MSAYLEERVEQVPPHSVQAERSVIGGLLLAPTTLARVSDWLEASDFYRRDHQVIYRAICELAAAGVSGDAVTLGEWADANGLTEQIGGLSYLIELASTTPSAANLVAYAEIVLEHSRMRSAIGIGTNLVSQGFNPSGKSAAEVAGIASQALGEIRQDTKAGGLLLSADSLKDWFADLTERYEKGAGVTGLPYPWFDVNKVTHGLQPGELTIIAARPSMGKSVMGLDIALFNAMRQVNTAFFSLEMTTRQVNRRCISSLQEVPHDWLLAPDKENDDLWTSVNKAVTQLRGASLLVDESAGLRVDQLVARARRAHMQKAIELIVVDHLHELAVKSDSARFDYGYAVGQLKALGKEFGCPVVVLAQLNRGVESRTDKRPVMADLRESGEIEQKADVIWFIYREDYYRRNDPGYQPQHDIELILAKGRDLQVGKPIRLLERFDVMRMEDWHGDPPDRQVIAQPKKGLS